MRRILSISLLIVSFLYTLSFSTNAFAARGGGGGASGGHALEFGAGLSTASQTDLNNWATAVGQSGASLSSGYEFTVSYLYRFSGSIFGLLFRPSYFTETGSSGNISQSLTGYTFYPALRMYPLENNFIHFFMQIGLGYGSLTGTSSNTSANSATFSGSAFGLLGGLGAEFCFVDSHCLTIEGNFRYHPIPRSTVSASSGALGGNMTQHATGTELEFASSDVQNTLSGIQGVLAYTLKF